MGPQLVEIEDMGPEDEIVGNLLDLEFRSGRNVPEVDDRVRLAVRVDVRIDARLDLGVPDISVRFAHDVVLVFLLRLRDSALRESAKPEEKNRDG